MSVFIENGGIYNIKSKRQLRILAHDNVEILYEEIEAGRWLLNEKPPNIYHFGRMDTNYFKYISPEKVGVEEFPIAMQNVIGPELPISLLRIKDVNWKDVYFSTYVNLKSKYGNIFHRKLSAHRLALAPLGPKGGMGKFEIIKTSMSSEFNEIDLLWKAAQIQQKKFLPTEGGIGVFRLGIYRNVPSFYIHGFYSISNAYRRFEEGIDWDNLDKLKEKHVSKLNIKRLENPTRYLIELRSQIDFTGLEMRVMDPVTGNVETSFVLTAAKFEIVLPLEKETVYWLEFYKSRKLQFRETLEHKGQL
jgi:hypothetical protein